MLIITTIMFLIYLISTYLFDRLRMALIVLTSASGFVLLLNDWDNTLVSDSTTKLVFILSFVLYSLMVLYNVFISKEEV